MAWRVGQNEVAFGRRKVAVGHVDRNTLLALVLEAVGQKSKTSQTYTVINVPDSRIRTVSRTFLFNLSFHKDKKS